MSKKYKNTIGGRIKRLMISKGITQGEMADMIGYTEYTVNLMCNDRTNVRADCIGAVAKILGTTTDYLIYGQDSTAGTMEKLACLCRDMESALNAMSH